MEELIFQIKELKSIRAQRKWARATKREILSQAENQGFSISFDWLRGRAFLFIPSLVALCLAGFLLYNNLIFLWDTSLDAQALEAMAENLKIVQADFMKLKVNVEAVEGPEKMVTFQDSMASAIASGEELVVQMKKAVEKPTIERTSPEAPEVLAVLIEVEQAVSETKEIYLEKQKSLAGQLIEELALKSLTEEQKGLLAEAQEDYAAGRFGEALVKALELSQRTNHSFDY